MSGTAAMGGSMVIQGDNTNMVLEDLMFIHEGGVGVYCEVKL